MESMKEAYASKQDDFYEFNDFCWIPNTIFKSIGYDFLKTPKSKVIRILFLAVSVIVITSHIYLNYSLIRQLLLVTFEENLMDIVRLASCVAYSLNSNIKFLGFLLHRKLAQHIYDTLQKIYPKTTEQKRSHRVKKFYWSKIERYATVLYIIACWNVVYCPLVQSIYIYINENTFPYLKCYPVDFEYEYRTPLRYLGVYLLEMAHSHYMVMVNWGTDLWLICFTAQICMHLSYISEAIKIYEPQLSNSKNDCAFLVQLIQTHQIILSLHVDLNEIFGIPLAFNLISTTGVFCIVAIRLIVEGLGLEFLSFGVFLVTAIVQFYMVCLYGNKLSELSENISEAAYMQNWYNASLAYKKLLCIIMLRAQKQAQLKAVGIQPLSLDTFKTFMGSAYRIFALLQTVLDLEF